MSDNLHQELIDLVAANTKKGFVRPEVAVAIAEQSVRREVAIAQQQFQSSLSLQVAAPILAALVGVDQPNDCNSSQDLAILAKEHADALVDLYV